MCNSVMLVGKLVNIEEDKIVVSVARYFKNDEGEYERDNIPVEVWGGINERVKEYCSIDDVIGIKGRLQMINNEVSIIAEKVTFLSSKKDNK